MEDDFSRLLEQSSDRRDNFSTGDRVEGRIVFITKDTIFVDITGKSEALMDSSDLMDNEGKLTVKNGDMVTAFVVSTAGGEIKISTKIGKGQAGLRQLELAYENKIPVTGIITSLIKGGYSVTVAGNRCFCPFSQFDLRSVPQPEVYLNKNMEFQILQYGERGRNIVLSRRALLEEEQEKNEVRLKDELLPGVKISGRIKSIREFGIFVDLGGAEALVPKSEISWSRNPDMSQFKEGDRLNVSIVSADWNSKKINASIKDTLPDPWSEISQLKPGDTVDGRVVNIIKSGAFIELKPGIEGFLHVSKMSYTKRINKPEDAVQLNSNAEVKISEIDPVQRKISLELVTGEVDPWSSISGLADDSIKTVKVETVVPAGLRVRLDNGMEGFIPKRELIHGKSDINSKYPAGTEFKAAVIEFNKTDKNLILSESAAEKLEERMDYEKFIKGSDSGAGSNLGAQFKNQFAQIQKKIDSGS